MSGCRKPGCSWMKKKLKRGARTACMKDIIHIIHAPDENKYSKILMKLFYKAWVLPDRYGDIQPGKHIRQNAQDDSQ